MTDALADIASEAGDLPVEAKPEVSLQALSALAAEVVDIDERIEKNQARIDELKQRRNRILGTELVDMFDGLRMEDVTVLGRKFEVKNYYRASIASDWDAERREAAFNYLEENEASDIITNQVVAHFSKEFADEAKALADYITQNYQMAAVERKRDVPWNRLTSWVKSMFESEIAEGAERKLPDLDVIGATVGRVVKIGKPRKTKGT